MEAMELQEIRRDYFDPKAVVSFPRYQLQMWPGMTTLQIGEHKL
jgi:hypothetical protein